MKHARLSLVLVLPLLALAGPVAGWRVSAGAPRNAGNVVELPTRPAAVVDGHCAEYDAQDAALALANGDGAGVSLRATADTLYVCFKDLPLTDNGTAQLPWAALYLDGNHDGGALPADTDFRVRITLDTPNAALEAGDGSGGWGVVDRPGWSAASVRRICGRALCADAEFSVAATLLANWSSEWGLALVHHWVGAPGDDYAWPWTGQPGVPSTWGHARRSGAPTSTSGPPGSTFTPPATATLRPTTVVTASATVSPTATGGTPTVALPTATPEVQATPTAFGTAMPPVLAALELSPASAFAGGTVRAWGTGYACATPGVSVTWPDGTRLALATEETFQVTLTLPLVPPGSFRLTAACADGSGHSAQAVLALRSAPPPPAVEITAPPGSLYTGQVTAWSAAGTTGITRLDWDFGDGAGLAHGPTPGHVFAAAGAYTVTLSAFDAAGRATTDVLAVAVLEPVAAGRFSRQPDERTVAFLNQSRGPFTQLRWEFGDGTHSDRSNTSHRYEQPGTYLPRLVASFPGAGGLPVERSAELGPLVIGDAGDPNLALAGLELVQMGFADGLLAAHRRTVARVHVFREGGLDGLAGRYDVRLRASGAGDRPLAGSAFLRRIERLADRLPAGHDVVTLELPDEWTAARPRAVADALLGSIEVVEPITLTAELRPLAPLVENQADNALARPVSFHATAAQDLLVSMPVEAGAEDLDGLFARLRRILPLAGTDLGLWLPLGGRQAAPAADRRSGAPAALDAAGLAWRSLGRPATRLHGVALSPDPDAGAADGCAYALPAGGPGFWLAAGQAALRVPDQPARNLVRVLARALGLPNARGGQPVEGPVDPAFPTVDGTLDADGLDLADLTRLDRAGHHDFLSPAACAGGRAWWSGHNYGRLVAGLTESAGRGGGPGTLVGRPAADEDPPAAASDYAVISGIVRAPGTGGERVVLDPIFHDSRRHAPDDDAPGRGNWSVTLLDAGGQVLFTRYMDITYPVGAGGQPRPRAFFQVLPWHAFTRRVILREGNELRWDRTVPAGWPAVRLLTPGAGDRWRQGGSYPVRWTASDATGSALSYQVDLSADDGNTWRPVGNTLDRPELTLESSALPGCEACRLRVRASNGLQMGEVLGEPFAIEAPAPIARIMAPTDGAILPANEPIWLEGVAYDATDGPLGAGQVTWRSNLDGSLGMEDTIQTLLSVGRHTLRFTALNSAGRATTDEITLQVVPGRRDHAIWLPWAAQP